MKKALLLAMLFTFPVYADPIENAPGGIPPYSQCFPWVYVDYFKTNGSFGSIPLAIVNQNTCRTERFKVAGY